MIWEPFQDEISKAPYMLLAERILMSILSGELLPGQKLPSIRELAERNRVSPNTFQKALYVLQRRGIITTQRTTGKFVTMDTTMIQEWKQSLIDKWVQSFIEKMDCLGLKEQEAVNEIINRL